MSLRSWLSRPLARFFRLTWLSRVPLLWRAGLSRPVSPRPGRPPRRPVSLALEVCEPRETPDDVLSVLRTGFAAGGLTLVGGQFASPLEVFFSGWDARLRGGTPAPAQQPGGVPRTPVEQAAPRPAAFPVLPLASGATAGASGAQAPAQAPS